MSPVLEKGRGFFIAKFREPQRDILTLNIDWSKSLDLQNNT